MQNGQIQIDLPSLYMKRNYRLLFGPLAGGVLFVGISGLWHLRRNRSTPTTAHQTNQAANSVGSCLNSESFDSLAPAHVGLSA